MKVKTSDTPSASIIRRVVRSAWFGNAAGASEISGGCAAANGASICRAPAPTARIDRDDQSQGRGVPPVQVRPMPETAKYFRAMLQSALRLTGDYAIAPSSNSMRPSPQVGSRMRA